MSFRSLILVLLSAIVLSACATPPTSGSATATPAAPAPTGAPTSQPTSPPPTSAATQAPEPTSAPTSAPPPTAAPTEPAPTGPRRPSRPKRLSRRSRRRQRSHPPPATRCSSCARARCGPSRRRRRSSASSPRAYTTSPLAQIVRRSRSCAARERGPSFGASSRDGSGLTAAHAQRSRRGHPCVGARRRGAGVRILHERRALRDEWQGWSRWCAASEIHLLNLAGATETSLAAGCDPAISPDGKRIGYAAPPATPEPGIPEPAPLTVNSIRLINRQGQNGWDFAKARGAVLPRRRTAAAWSTRRPGRPTASRSSISASWATRRWSTWI